MSSRALQQGCFSVSYAIEVTMTEKDKKKSIKDIEKKIKEPSPSRA